MSLIKVQDLEPGDLIDLEGDSFGNNEFAEFEYAVVLEVERETADCVRVDTDQGSFGFPIDHTLTRE